MSIPNSTMQDINRIANAIERIANHLTGVMPETPKPEPKPEPKPKPEAKPAKKTGKAKPEKQTKTLADFEDPGDDDDLFDSGEAEGDDLDDDFDLDDAAPEKEPKEPTGDEVIEAFYKLMNDIKELPASKGGSMASARTVAKQIAGTYFDGKKPTAEMVEEKGNAVQVMREIKNVAKIKGV